uniref:Uncharacterized protein n=1 Tax=Brassica campestris TaxID=3711 RepID=A0A3P6BAH7_BRACM|nr:unnamed protein product [Brassica rapa]
MVQPQEPHFFQPLLPWIPDSLDNTHCIFLQAHPREDEWEHMDTNIRRYGSNMASDTRREATHPKVGRSSLRHMTFE